MKTLLYKKLGISEGPQNKNVPKTAQKYKHFRLHLIWGRRIETLELLLLQSQQFSTRAASFTKTIFFVVFKLNLNTLMNYLLYVEGKLNK